MKSITNRLHKLRRRLVEKDVEAIFISQPENRYYLSGFTGSAGFLLITPDKAILATDFRYIEQVKVQAPDFEVFQIAYGLPKWFPELVSGLNIKDLGIESGHITLDLYRQLGKIVRKCQPRIKLVPMEGTVETLRALKEPEEIAFIKEAAAISDSAMDYIETQIHPDMTEQEVGWELEKYMREHGSQSMPFEIIVASGPNAALPHARCSARSIKTGEPVVMDIGARVNGYCSDLTRTICLGRGDTFNKIYKIVLDAQSAAMPIIKEGITGEQADNAGRAVIHGAGYGENFGHSLGHGIGLAPHELPHLGPRSKDLLKSGMVFSIEPGIYLPNWGGVRIEDIAVIADGKTEVISKARKMIA